MRHQNFQQSSAFLLRKTFNFLDRLGSTHAILSGERPTPERCTLFAKQTWLPPVEDRDLFHHGHQMGETLFEQ